MFAVDRVALIDPLIVAVAVLLLSGLAYVGRVITVSALRVVAQVRQIAADLESRAAAEARALV